ncbi:S-layer homology domain-containing protein [Thermovenabulum sp.]|uniref:S-layer homology domain-containing protein n=1 Tax=Thermovenabulum sp. TaxID=3100335 RepID=UPI003C7B61D0
MMHYYENSRNKNCCNMRFFKKKVFFSGRLNICNALLILILALSMVISPLLPFPAASAGEGGYKGVPYAGVFQKTFDFQDTKNHWAESSIKRVYALLLMTGDGKRFYPGRILKREEALSVLMRLFSEKAKNNGAKNLPGSTAAAQIKASEWAKEDILKAKNAGIISDEELNTTDFTLPASREEVFYFTAKALNLPAEENYDRNLSVFQDAGEIDYKKAGYIAALFEKGYIYGSAGKLYPKKSISRAEFAAFLDRFLEKDSSPYTVNEGKVTGRDSGFIQIRLYTGENIKIDRVAGSLDFPVLKGKNLYLSDSLNAGDQVKLFIKNNSVLLAQVLGTGEKALSGSIEKYDPSKRLMVLKADDGNNKNYYLVSGAEVYMGQERVSEKEIQSGVEATIRVFGDRVFAVYLKGEDYQAPREMTLKGMVLTVSAENDAVKVTLVNFDGEDRVYEEFYAYPDTEVLKAGEKVDYENISPGDELEAKVISSGQTKKALQVSLLPGEGVNAILKGKIEKSDFNGALLLSNVKEFFMGRFYDKGRLFKINIDGDTRAYLSGESIPIVDIFKLQGKEAYVACSGDEKNYKALKVVVKNGDEYLENGFFKPVWSLNIINFTGSQGTFDDSTIASCNDTIILPEVLEEQKEAFAVFNKEGNSIRIPVLYQPVYYPSDISIIKGKIYEIREDSVGIKYQRDLYKNDWSSKDSAINYHNLKDSLCFVDFISSKAKVLTKEDFIKDRFYKNYYYKEAYLVKKKDSVLGIVLVDEEKEDIISLGRISSIAVPPEVATVERMQDFSPFNGKWNYDSASLDINLSGALVIKEGKILDPYGLNVGDRIYFIRDNNRALVIFKF